MARFQKGDVVRCVTHQYSSINRGETRTVLEVIDAEKWELIKLINPSSPYGRGTSNYTAFNFELVYRKQETTMGYERTKFFAIKLYEGMLDPSIHVERGVTDGDSTPMRDTRHQVQVDVANLIKHGDKWLVCQTVMMIEGEEPRPPMKITEYK